jgi:hypothetical protein
MAAVEQSTMLGFSWEFLDQMTVWTAGLAIAVALIGGIALGSVPFAAGCLVAAGIDVVLVRISTHRASRELADGRIDAVAPIVMLGGRLLVKAGLLVLAIFVPAVLGFAGTATGALMFDTTLVVVGSIIAAQRVMQHPKEGR